MYPQQGEVFYIDLPEQGGFHYVVVVPDSRFNKGRRTLVVPFTSQNIARHSAAGLGAIFQADTYTFITQLSVVPAEWMSWCFSLSLDKPIAILSQNDINRVLSAIAIFFNIPTYMDTDETV